MIQFGTTLQESENKLPKEIADWLKERQGLYPNVDFEVNRNDSVRSDAKELAKAYSRALGTRNFEKLGVEQVIFLYGDEQWHIRIKGSADKSGRILDATEKASLDSFDIYPIPSEVANKIAGLDSLSGFIEQRYDDGRVSFLLPRKEGEIAPERANEFVEFDPELRYKSELDISGAELNTLMSDPATKKELLEATSWDEVREIRKKNEN